MTSQGLSHLGGEAVQLPCSHLPPVRKPNSEMGFEFDLPVSMKTGYCPAEVP